MTEQLQALRAQIDAADGELIRAFCRRMEICTEIGRLKATAGLFITDNSRELQVIENAVSRADEPYRSAAEYLIKVIIELSKSEQRRCCG